MRPLAHKTLKSLRDYYRVGLTYSSNAPEMTRALLKWFSDSGKIEYYQNLSEVEKSVYKAFAIKAEINNPGEIADLLKIRIKVTQKLVGECIAEALSIGILLPTNDSRHIMY